MTLNDANIVTFMSGHVMTEPAVDFSNSADSTGRKVELLTPNSSGGWKVRTDYVSKAEHSTRA